LTEYKIAETDSFRKKISGKKYAFWRDKLRNYVYPLLRANPYFGPQIKKLKGAEYKNIFRFRLGDYRLFYKVEESIVVVFVFDIEHRKDAYR
jgi:mRNA interferase RelE/StbE